MPTKDAVDKVSRYRVVSRSLFRTKEGQVVKLVYATRTSRVFPLPLSAAQHIERGQVPTGLSDNLLGSLRRHEVLIPEEQDELAEVTHRFVSRAADLSRRHVILLPTSYCNMGCTYCGQSHERITLRGRHRDAVRTRVLAILNHPHARSVRLDWFGAEPLMALAPNPLWHMPYLDRLRTDGHEIIEPEWKTSYELSSRSIADAPVMPAAATICSLISARLSETSRLVPRPATPARS